MIYFFTGNSEFLVREKTLLWKNQYIKKYGDFNLTHFKEIEKIDNNQISQELLSEGFFQEKKLIIINNIPSGTNSINDLKQKQDFILNLLDKIPENNIVVFSTANPDKRSKIYKQISKLATKIEEFNLSGQEDIFFILNKKYFGKIDTQALKLLIQYKAGNLNKIIQEIEKLLIFTDFVKVEYIKKYIFPELEESIFQLIDNIMNLNISESLSKIEIILTQTSVYAFYNNLIANLRVLVFIQKLKNNNINNVKELLDLKNRSFLVNKNYKINFNDLQKLYIGLINLDKKMKSGKMIGSEEEVLKYEIEKEILKLG